eukprot:COSAG01_NODE_1767_length_9258_cov_3.704523_5_plen_61_part_00
MVRYAHHTLSICTRIILLVTDSLHITPQVTTSSYASTCKALLLAMGVQGKVRGLLSALLG